MSNTKEHLGLIQLDLHYCPLVQSTHYNCITFITPGLMEIFSMPWDFFVGSSKCTKEIFGRRLQCIAVLVHFSAEGKRHTFSHTHVLTHTHVRVMSGRHGIWRVGALVNSLPASGNHQFAAGIFTVVAPHGSEPIKPDSVFRSGNLQSRYIAP